MEPGVHRWIGVLGVVNRASTDRRVLAYDAVPEELAPYLKRGRVRWPHPATLPHLRYRPLPLPMCSALVSHHGDVGEVDGLAMTAWGQVVGTGTIAIPAGAAWGAWLLAGGDQPVGMTVRDGEGEIVDVVRRSWRSLFRRVTTQHHVFTGWLVEGLTLVEEAAWPREAAFIRLVRPSSGACSWISPADGVALPWAF
jgi:hypothetical protein